MYLRKLTLKNTGPLENFEYTFCGENDAAAFTPVVGANGSGKTLILKSIALLSLSSALINCTGTPPTHFRGRDDSKPTEMIAEWEIPGQAPIISSATLAPHRSLFDAHTDGGQGVDRLLEIQNGGALASQAFLATYHKDRYCTLTRPQPNFTPPEMRGTNSLLDEETPLGLSLWGKLSVKQLIFFRTQMRRLITTFSMDTLEDLILNADGISNSTGVDRRECVRTSHGATLPVTRLGHGYQSLISLFSDMLLRLILHQPHIKSLEAYQGTILIDEIEVGLHICLQRNLTAHLHRIFPNLQIIYTTHSPSMLDCMERDNIICL